MHRGVDNHSPTTCKIQAWRVKIKTHLAVWQCFFFPSHSSSPLPRNIPTQWHTHTSLGFEYSTKCTVQIWCRAKQTFTVVYDVPYAHMLFFLTGFTVWNNYENYLRQLFSCSKKKERKKGERVSEINYDWLAAICDFPDILRKLFIGWPFAYTTSGKVLVCTVMKMALTICLLYFVQ
jgi:hypothetical protein